MTEPKKSDMPGPNPQPVNPPNPPAKGTTPQPTDDHTGAEAFAKRPVPRTF